MWPFKKKNPPLNSYTVKLSSPLGDTDTIVTAHDLEDAKSQAQSLARHLSSETVKYTVAKVSKI